MAKNIVLLPERCIFATSLLLSARGLSWAQCLNPKPVHASPDSHQNQPRQTQGADTSRPSLRWTGAILCCQLNPDICMSSSLCSGMQRILRLSTGHCNTMPKHFSLFDYIVNSGKKSQMLSCNSSRVSDQSKSSGPTCMSINGDSHAGNGSDLRGKLRQALLFLWEAG